MRKVGVIALGTWFPETIRENNAWPAAFVDNFKNKRVSEDLKTFVDLKVADTDNELVIEYLKQEMDDPFFGTVQRRVADETTTAVEAETLAAMKVLKKAGIDGKEIDLLISYSSLPDRIAPCGANAVAYNIGADRAHCVGVDTSCASTLSQIILAKSMVESGAANYALLVQSHVVLKSWPLMHPASPNVGDGATAILLGPVDKHAIIGSYALSHGEYYTSVTYTRGKEEDLPWWQASNKPFYLGSYDSVKAKQLILSTISVAKDTITKAAQAANRPVDSIDTLISVQPRKWVPEGIARALGLGKGVAVETFEKFAHLGPCGIITNLEEAEDKGILKPGDIVALYAQGAGFCRTSVILEW